MLINIIYKMSTEEKLKNKLLFFLTTVALSDRTLSLAGNFLPQICLRDMLIFNLVEGNVKIR